MNYKVLTRPKKRGGLGIRRARWTNTALLGKIIWDMLSKPGKLWVQLLSSKYLRENSLLNARRKNGDSYIWRSITKAIQALEDGYKIRIGNGNISF